MVQLWNGQQRDQIKGTMETLMRPDHSPFLSAQRAFCTNAGKYGKKEVVRDCGSIQWDGFPFVSVVILKRKQTQCSFYYL